MSSSRAVLPPNWSRDGPDGEGRYWYANSVTGESRWDMPTEKDAAAPAASPSFTAANPAFGSAPAFTAAGGGATAISISLKAPAFCFPPAKVIKELPPAAAGWHAHVSLFAKIGIVSGEPAHPARRGRAPRASTPSASLRAPERRGPLAHTSSILSLTPPPSPPPSQPPRRYRSSR